MRGALIGLVSIREKDQSKLRKGMFEDFLERRLAYRLVKFLMVTGRMQRLLRFLFSCIGLQKLFFLKIIFKTGNGSVAVYEYANESRCIFARVPDAQGNVISFSTGGFHPLAALAHLWALLRMLKWAKVKQFFYLSNKLMKKHGILIGARQSEFLFFYLFFQKYFAGHAVAHYRLAVSTESNPNVIAVVLAAKNYGAKIVYVNHSFLDAQLGLFFHDAYIVQGTRLFDRIRSNMPAFTKPEKIEIVGPYYSRHKLRVPRAPVRVVGIVCSLVPDAKKVHQAIGRLCSTNQHLQIVVRLHPNKIFSKKLEKELRAYPFVKLANSCDWKEFNGEEWDLAIAGNTSAHIDLITRGVPTVGYDLDNHPPDMYEFYANNFVLKVDDFIDLHLQIASFYASPKWQEVCEGYIPVTKQGPIQDAIWEFR